MRFQTFRLFSFKLVPSLACLILLSATSQAQTLKSEYLNWIKIAADAGWADHAASIERCGTVAGTFEIPSNGSKCR